MSLDFDALFEGVSGGMTKEEAVYALLKIAMVIDGETDAREVAQLSAILKRSKTLLGAKDGAEQVIRKVDERLASASTPEALHAAAKDACASLKHEGEEISKSVFTQALDIMLADTSVHPNEKVLIQLLSEHLAIPDDFVRMAVVVITSKNKY
jgi:uncharacterized tellurite resistance protein B-like protein